MMLRTSADQIVLEYCAIAPRKNSPTPTVGWQRMLMTRISLIVTRRRLARLRQKMGFRTFDCARRSRTINSIEAKPMANPAQAASTPTR
jgi:hypothetical protein